MLQVYGLFKQAKVGDCNTGTLVCVFFFSPLVCGCLLLGGGFYTVVLVLVRVLVRACVGVVSVAGWLG